MQAIKVFWVMMLIVITLSLFAGLRGMRHADSSLMLKRLTFRVVLSLLLFSSILLWAVLRV